ncbi:uncharacterized protein MELLADRAFT_68597 [Melampsora larici-populina 98AG31]|uniref:Uncharacterized protein n=1 Tax=Melampsora larici-populina (strain 98AG31 / pathotype 3-4-7) TaxID=747676 RepID=F4S7D9_MELLP|nr:uncharacterized protein MELLADRAFT_68597 [Melampsora larici-populina 98AG31]EGF99389.1 hypothetical protein MELLADRAFT_68597 [Melampsora larici-populina 98AG31]
MSEHYPSDAPPFDAHQSDDVQSVPDISERHGFDSPTSEGQRTKTDGYESPTSEGPRSVSLRGELMETEPSDPPDSDDSFVIPLSEIDRGERVSCIIDAILDQDMTVRQFIGEVRPTPYTLINPTCTPNQRQIVIRSIDAINYMRSQNLNVEEFIHAILDRTNEDLWPHQASFRGTGIYSCAVIQGIFIGLRNQICGAGNEQGIWCELIQWEANDLRIIVAENPSPW